MLSQLASSSSSSGALNLQFVMLFIAIFLLAFYWVRLPRNLPPGPRGWPVIGNLLAIRSGGHFFKLLDRWAREYHSSVISVSLGRKLIIVLSEWRCIKEALINQAEVFSDRSVSDSIRLMWGVQGSFIFESGAIWKERRRFGLRALRNLGMGKKSTELSINEEARYLLDCLSKQVGQRFDPTHLVNNAVSNIICTMSFGCRFDYSDPKFAKLIAMLGENMRATGPSSPLNSFSWLAHTPFYSRVKQQYEALNAFIGGIVQEHRDGYDQNHIRDVIDMYFSELEEWQRRGKVGGMFEWEGPSDRTLNRSILDLFIAGTDTTTTTLLWFIMYMALNPDIQKRVQAEINDVMGDSRQPSLADGPSMPYTSAALLEILRIRPVVPLAVPHQARETTTLDGYTIPKEKYILINIWSLHHDPSVWPDPDRYDPTRFLSADGKRVVSPEKFIPFGIGRRACMGESLARASLFLFAVNLLQQFTFRFPKDKPIPSQEGIFGMIHSPGPFEICIDTQRN